ncbi:MAG: hypothetical protein K2O29_02805 [Ruminococcus sp.]|nr:hypothetical protein [Ruminococcus sp.]MDE6848663.1 hypothetical protein [Ruminococcus sp.]MDE7137376.1 hypothetical protein [Ruminococcus sp.]
MNNVENFNEDEKKAIDKYSWLNSLFLLVNGIVLVYGNNTVKQGAYHLYLVTALLIISAVITAMTVVTYFRKIRYIRKYKSRYLISVSLIAFLFVLHVFICGDYVTDIFAGERTIITSEYSTLWGYFHTEIDGEEIRLDLTDKTLEKLRDNEYIDSEEIYNFDKGTYYYKKKVHVTYYPNSRILKEAFFEE